MDKKIGLKRIIISNMLIVLGASILAIVIKSTLPADVNVEDFDSTLVKLIGFPAVATLYFIVLYSHCVMVIQYFGKKSKLSKLQIGFRFGVVFALIYIFGMQEVVVEASPFDEWGFSFVKYQFFIGITDALPAFLLCMASSYFTLNDGFSIKQKHLLSIMDKINIVIFVTLTFLIQRAIGYEIGFVDSNISTFPVPTYLWTIIFGIILGLSYLYLYPIFSKEQDIFILPFKIVVLTIGVNWIVFNSFIGLIFDGVMVQMLFRTGIDILVFYLSVVIVHMWIVKVKNSTT